MAASSSVVCLLFVIYIVNSLEFKVVDLTHEYNNLTIYWPGNPEYNFTQLSRGQSDQGYWYESNYFGTAEHGGTHVDAPAHFYKDKWRTASIPMEYLVGPGVIVNVKDKAVIDADYRVTVTDLMDWENTYGKIPDKAVVLMNSGWHDRYPNASLVFNTDTPTIPASFHFPGWHEDTVTWLINQRSVNVIGVDTPSVDYGQSSTFPVHVAAGGANIPGAENVANLDKIPNAGSIIYVAVTKIFDGSGGPARIFATVSKDTSSGHVIVSSVGLLIGLLAGYQTIVF